MRRFADSMTWSEDKGFAIDSAMNARMGFIRRTYAHLVGELAAVALVVYVAIGTPALQELGIALISAGTSTSSRSSASRS
jgi:hypothetical protein